MFSPLVRHWNATPATRPPSSTGPPLLPLLIAASTFFCCFLGGVLFCCGGFVVCVRRESDSATTHTATQALHACGIVHRDVKPANLVLGDAARRFRLIDLGAAADLRGGTNYKPAETILDPCYCPPEEVRPAPCLPACLQGASKQNSPPTACRPACLLAAAYRAAASSSLHQTDSSHLRTLTAWHRF